MEPRHHLTVMGPNLVAWRKSSRSGESGGNCVEVAALLEAMWTKSSRSGENGGNCVEVAGLSRAVAIRDSKNPNGPVLVVSVAEWRNFLDRAKSGAIAGTA
jgi:hypothetical protein